MAIFSDVTTSDSDAKEEFCSIDGQAVELWYASDGVG